MAKKDARVDAYIARSAEFARPILKRLRKVVHVGCPEVEETIKWGFPHFMHKGILCSMAAFTRHCTFGFWKATLLRGGDERWGKVHERAMGQFGRITALADLPGERTLLRYVKEAAALNERGVRLPVKAKARGQRELEIPGYFMDALRENKRALHAFEGFSHSHKQAYVEWVTEAKREETRRRRLETAVAWMAQGRSRDWKYASRSRR